MQIIRSTLTPYWHPTRKKYIPRGTYPIRLEDGTIGRKRGFLGTGSDTKALCRQDCDRLNQELEAAASAGPLEPTFEEAVLIYLGAGGDRRFLGEEEGKPRNKLLDFLGQYRVNEINDQVMIKALTAIYPTATPATINRQLYTPVISVLRMASKGKPWKPDLTRPKGHAVIKRAKPPPAEWFPVVLPQCNVRLAALLLFCTSSGRRTGEAIKCLPDDFDPVRGTVTIDKDKRGNTVTVHLARQVLEALHLYDWRLGPGLFGNYVPKNRRNVFRDLEAACKRAKVPYYQPHKVGRHAFAKRFLEAGYSIAHLMGAGGWDDPKMPTMLYGHFAHSEVAEDVKRVAEDFLSRVEVEITQPKTIELQPQDEPKLVTKRLQKQA